MRAPRLHRSFVALLVALVALLLLTPLLQEDRLGRAVNAALLVGLLGSSFAAVSAPRWQTATAAAFGVAGISMSLIGELNGGERLASAGHLLFATYLGFVVVSLLRGILRSERVTADALAGGICVYLLIAFTWAGLFSALEQARPGSFLENGVSLEHIPHRLFHGLLYFSVVTVTTLGYGDIVAVTPFARTLAMLAALSGQIYLAVFVAGLVGLLIAAQRGRE